MFTINSKTSTTYGYYHTHTEIEPPEPKRSIGSVPLADGIIDFTALLSPLQFYETREIRLTMETTKLRSQWLGDYKTVMKDLHGKQVTLEIDNDTAYYWTGYATVGPLEDHGASAAVTITVEAAPFKRTKTKTTLYNAAVSGDVAVTATVSEMRGYLTFTTSAANCTVTYDGQTWTLPLGVSTAYGLTLTTGNNSITLHASGATIKVELEEGTL